jgi:DNA topoisomerase-1
VNAYLKQITGDDFTSKDFRTWAGSVLAVRALRQSRTFASQAQAKRNLALAIESVARQLGNTTAVCRKCYVHPAVIDAYLDGSLPQRVQGRREEAAVLAIVRAARNGATHRSVVPLLRRSLAQTRLTARSLREKHGNPTYARGAPP